MSDNFVSQSAERLKLECSRLKLKQFQAAELCGVSREMWGKYERGQAVPGGEVLFSFAAVGADVQYILTGIRSATLQPMTPREAALLDNYRHIEGEEDKRAIDQVALRAAEVAKLKTEFKEELVAPDRRKKA
jgi:transcriptional regulator with XRE-family HTH domain